MLALFGAIVTLLSLLEVAVSFSLRWAIVLACPHVARYVFVLNVHVVGKCLREPLGRWVAIIFQLTYHYHLTLWPRPNNRFLAAGRAASGGLHARVGVVR